MTELPPDPPRLRAILAHLEQQLADTETVGIYLRLQVDAVRKALTAAERPAPGRQQLPQSRPALAAPAPTSGYKVEKVRREGHPLSAVIHRADCIPQRGTRPISADDARAALSRDRGFFRACDLCRPDTELGILD
jgi:hypothetical protein